MFKIKGFPGDEGIDNLGGGTYDGGGEQQQGTTGINPSWNEYLKEVPQELHEKVIPAFKAWDQGFQSQVQKVHSEYKTKYDPWEPVITAGGDPQYAQQAINVLRLMESNPQFIWEQMRDYYKFGQDSSDKSNSEQGLEPENALSPEFSQLKMQLQQQQEQMQKMVDYFVAARQQEVIAAEDAKLEKDLATARNTYQLDNDAERWILAQLQANPELSVDDAAKSYVAFADKIAQQWRPRPLIMGSGGNMPGQGLNVKQLSEKGAKDAVVQMLQGLKQQR